MSPGPTPGLRDLTSGSARTAAGCAKAGQMVASILGAWRSPILTVQHSRQQKAEWDG